MGPSARLPRWPTGAVAMGDAGTRGGGSSHQVMVDASRRQPFRPERPLCRQQGGRGTGVLRHRRWLGSRPRRRPRFSSPRWPRPAVVRLLPAPTARGWRISVRGGGVPASRSPGGHGTPGQHAAAAVAPAAAATAFCHHHWYWNCHRHPHRHRHLRCRRWQSRAVDKRAARRGSCHPRRSPRAPTGRVRSHRSPVDEDSDSCPQWRTGRAIGCR